MYNTEVVGKSESSCIECNEQFMAVNMNMNMGSELHNTLTHSWTLIYG